MSVSYYKQGVHSRRSRCEASLTAYPSFPHLSGRRAVQRYCLDGIPVLQNLGEGSGFPTDAGALHIPCRHRRDTETAFSTTEHMRLSACGWLGGRGCVLDVSEVEKCPPHSHSVYWTKASPPVLSILSTPFLFMNDLEG